MVNIDTTAAKDISRAKRPSFRTKQDESRSAAAQKMVSAKAPGKHRTAKEHSQASTNIGSDTPGPKRRGPGKKLKASAVMYRDPASDKTWSGLGRKPN